MDSADLLSFQHDERQQICKKVQNACELFMKTNISTLMFDVKMYLDGVVFLGLARCGVEILAKAHFVISTCLPIHFLRFRVTEEIFDFWMKID